MIMINCLFDKIKIVEFKLNFISNKHLEKQIFYLN